ncbi:MAG: hypothetical protein KGQ28_05990 [Hyphomicrobiales bacterium]|nr:hypothetical protein [Hyphomicrobiales bacterium]
MSSIFNGGSNIFIAAHTSQGWVFTWGNGGWQGNVLNEPQPLNTGAAMSFTTPTVSQNSNGTYSFAWTATNNGPNSTFFNIQTSAS